MIDNSDKLDFKEDDKPIAFSDLLLKYLRYWPWFIISCGLFLALGYYYTKYSPKTYNSIAKVKILDENKRTKIIPNEIALANQNMRLNLENHVEVLKSYRLLNNVVRELKLDIEYYELEDYFFSQVYTPPFEVKKKMTEDDLEKPMEFEIILRAKNVHITEKDGKKYILPYNKKNSFVASKLPFIFNFSQSSNLKDYLNVKYKIILRQERQATMLLAKKLNISTSEKQSEILSLSLKGESRALSEAILNSIVKNFDEDGIVDRQLGAKRTLEVIDKRFIYLTAELDSIEAGKENFKKIENLSYIEADADESLKRKSEATTKVAELQTQISLSQLLKSTVSEEKEYELLPGNIGLDNSGLNNLVAKYNDMARERQKLVMTVGANHPSLKTLSEQLDLAKQNILNSVNVYKSQLRLSLRRLNLERENAGHSFAKLPEKERVLRSIERQQSIKEDLFLLLLKKREEAAIDYAATTPTVKVVDFGLTPIKPMWPKKSLVYPLSLLLGMLVPFFIIYIRSSMNNIVYDRTDIERLNPEIPVLIEIPFFKKEKSFANVNDRSALAESFRILSTNTDYLLPEKGINDSKVIYVTSTIKGEGKTLLAMNLSLSYASMGKRVLLVGADLRNPQLHNYINVDKNVKGLSDYLLNRSISFNDGLHQGFGKNINHKVYFSGAIPNNAPILLSSRRFGDFITRAKQEFDYVIVDCAPTMLVTDTLLISKYADITLFAVRSGYTDKKLLKFSKELNRSKKLNKIAYVLNAVGQIKGTNHNYGYGYGYGSSKESRPWYRKKAKNNNTTLKKSA